MRVYVECGSDCISKSIEAILLPLDEQVLKEKEILSFFETYIQKQKLYQLFSKFETICIGDLTLTKKGIDTWKLKDRRPNVRRHILQVLNNLPWEAESEVTMDEDNVLEIITKTEREIDINEFGDSGSDYSEDEIAYFEKKIKEKLGKKLIINFESIEKVFNIIDECIGDLHFP